MKINEYVHYIKSEKWDEFLKSYEKFGFKRSSGYVYPERVSRSVSDGVYLDINVSDPIINMWDKEDKNHQREIWIHDGHFGFGLKERTEPYIRDLIEAGFVERSGSGE